ncbi:hypothetical protein ID866_4709 [Astraeus odoratus]|nr:hypothetical protein ID866_4709 [Astraeus odoratus]
MGCTDSAPEVPLPSASTSRDSADVSGPPSRENILLRRPAITSFVALATFLIPFAIIPYVSASRRITRMSRQLDQLAATTDALRKNVQTLSREVVIRKELDVLRQDLLLLRRDIEQSRARLESSDSARRAEWLKHTGESKHIRERLDMLLPQLGTSLADIAAFMEETELLSGPLASTTDKHGVEKLRMLALRMQNRPTEAQR